MILIKRYATSSTNEEIKDLVQKEQITEPVCLYSKCQTEGKGQLGNIWASEPFKNLTCSFYFHHIGIPIEKQFYLSVFVALAIIDTLKDVGIKKSNIKWPNDILAGNQQKVCGILIENTLSGSLIKDTIIGIGLNVNQKKFPDLPNATSIALELGEEFKIDFVLDRLISHFRKLNKHNVMWVNFNQYYQKLYRFNQIAHFKDEKHQIFIGKIQGVTNTGLLRVYKFQDQKIENYDMKEIKFLDQS